MGLELGAGERARSARPTAALPTDRAASVAWNSGTAGRALPGMRHRLAASLAIVMGLLAGCGGGVDVAAGAEAGKEKAEMKVKYSKSGYDITPLSEERSPELAAKLDPEAYRITQKAGTEPAFCGNLLDNQKDGDLHLRRLRPAALLERAQVPLGDRLAELLPRVRPGARHPQARTGALAWCAPRSTAPAAAPTSATSSTTARSRPASGTASTPPR